MNILYIGYWGANEGLSKATIYPHLEILSRFDINRIIYVSIERSGDKAFNLPDIPILKHIPLYSGNYGNRFLNKFYDFMQLPEKMFAIASQEKISQIICRTSLAGRFGSYLNDKLSIPYSVESFEPHADYMTETGNWKKWGLSSYLEKKWARKQLKTAKMIMPVSYNYANKLISEGVPEQKIKVQPCCVDINEFRFDKSRGNYARNKLGYRDSDLVGIYVGKFGGIYFPLSEACELFKKIRQQDASFKLIILTPQDAKEIIGQLVTIGFKRDDLYVDKVDHSEVSGFLSASDFAFSLHRPTDSMSFVSPIKNGEYWANGLPVIISEGIGDDSAILEKSGLGMVIYSSSHFMDQWATFKMNIDPTKRERISKLAIRHRSFSLVEDIYRGLVIENNGTLDKI